MPVIDSPQKLTVQPFSPSPDPWKYIAVGRIMSSQVSGLAEYGCSLLSPTW